MFIKYAHEININSSKNYEIFGKLLKLVETNLVRYGNMNIRKYNLPQLIII